MRGKLMPIVSPTPTTYLRAAHDYPFKVYMTCNMPSAPALIVVGAFDPEKMEALTFVR